MDWMKERILARTAFLRQTSLLPILAFDQTSSPAHAMERQILRSQRLKSPKRFMLARRYRIGERECNADALAIGMAATKVMDVLVCVVALYLRTLYCYRIALRSQPMKEGFL